jgi:transposase-like protein
VGVLAHYVFWENPVGEYTHPTSERKETFMGFWEHRAVQDRCDLADLKSGAVRDDETPPEEMNRRRLSPRQMTALKAFHSGSSLADAAKAAGVTRQTLHRWRTQYHSFAEAMEVWEEGQMIIARSRLVDMASNAVNALESAIEDGELQPAMLVLKSLRILRTYAPLKPPAEKMPGAAREQTSRRAVEQEKEAVATQANGATPAQPLSAPAAVGEARKAAAGSGKAAAGQPNPAKTATVAQHITAISNPPIEMPKSAILAGKAGSAIKNACYSALQEVTGSYQMLHAAQG